MAATPSTTSPGAEVLLMLLADARLPTGAHTQSAGIEAALRAGTRVSAVPDYIRARLATVTAVEAAAAVLARHTVMILRSGHGLVVELAAIDTAWRARTISPAVRENAEQLGRGYQRLLCRLWPAHPGVIALAGISKPVRAVTVGVAAAAAGLTAVQTARLVGYDDAQTVAAAVLKIQPMDPVDAAGWLVDLAADIDRLAAATAAISTIEKMPAWSAPEIERWAELHAATAQRLFRA